MRDVTVPVSPRQAKNWYVCVGYAGRIAYVSQFSAKVFAEAEAKRIRAKYPDPLAEFWVTHSSIRPNRSWANIEPNLQTSGPAKEIFGGSTKEAAHRRVSFVVGRAILATIAQERVDPNVSCLPYTIKELMDHIAAQFREGMSWANYKSEWVIDHIEPRAAFDMRDPKQLMRCWALSNLQPLWVYENNAKGTADKAFVHATTRQL